MNEESVRPRFIIPRHLAIIMDGNGRWAKERGLPRSAGHLAGMQKVRQVVEHCCKSEIRVLTLFAFSTENWGRPAIEVNYLMLLAEEYANRELPELQRNGIRLQLMGKRGGLPDSVMNALENTARQTSSNSQMVLNLAINYGGRSEIVDAARAIITDFQKGLLKESEIDEEIVNRYMYCSHCPDVDLVVRTGGEWRMSNFMLWRASNAIFVSLPVFWPDFKPEDLGESISFYQQQILKWNEHE